MRSKINMSSIQIEFIFPKERSFKNEEAHKKESFNLLNIVGKLDHSKASMN